MLCGVRLSSAKGTCTLSTTKLGTGTYHVVGSYSGDGNFDSSATSKKTLEVSSATSRTALALSPSRVTYGGEEAEHVSVAVSPEFAGSMPTGTVTLRDSTRILCVVRLRSARGSCGMSPAELGAGSYRLVATYNDSADFGSSAAGETLTVSRARSRPHSGCPLPA